MKKYYVTGLQNRVVFFEIIGDTEDSYLVRLTRRTDGETTILEERMSHDLFDICLETGYIDEAEDTSEKDGLTKAA
jgi:hypothetical protein